MLRVRSRCCNAQQHQVGSRAPTPRRQELWTTLTSELGQQHHTAAYIMFFFYLSDEACPS